MKLRGEMELPVSEASVSTSINIRDVHACPKCGRDDFDLHYDGVFDLMRVTCGICGYTFECAPADNAPADDAPAGAQEVAKAAKVLIDPRLND